MDTSTITGFAALEKGASLTPYTYESSPLGEHDVRIDITHCGLCGTDIQAIDDYYDITDYPFIPGHEVVGRITDVGSSISSDRIGERVGVGWQGRTCMKCEWCQQGLVHLCQDVVNNASWKPYGGFSSSISVNGIFAYKLPDGMPSEEASVLMCAGITVFTPLFNNRNNDQQRIGIVGVGGLGHLAIQYARALGFEVTAISTSPTKRGESLALGAHRFLLINDKEQEREYGYYFDLILCTAHGSVDWVSMLEILKKRGRLILTGFPDMNFKPVDLVAHELSISGSFLGTPSDMRTMLQFSNKHAIKPMVELMPMSAVNEAIQRVKENKARYRIVLYNDLNTSGK